MKFAARLRKLFQTKRRVKAMSDRWADDHYAGASREIASKVAAIVGSRFGVPFATLKPTTKLVDDLHADDLDVVELVMVFEDEFKLMLVEEVMMSFSTLDDVIQYIVSNTLSRQRGD
jgi:acyl carrier protein